MLGGYRNANGCGEHGSVLENAEAGKSCKNLLVKYWVSMVYVYRFSVQRLNHRTS